MRKYARTNAHTHLPTHPQSVARIKNSGCFCLIILHRRASLQEENAQETHLHVVQELFANRCVARPEFLLTGVAYKGNTL